MTDFSDDNELAFFKGQDMSQIDITVPQHLFDRIVKSVERHCKEIRNCDPKKLATTYIENAKYGLPNFIEFGLTCINFDEKAKILEIGSGFGLSLLHSLKKGFNVCGIEPGEGTAFENRYETALELLKANGIIPPESYIEKACAEKLHFEDNSFDLAISIGVFEHVVDMEKCVREAVRVVKPGGLIILNVPNYDSFYEGHYDILWLPYILRNKNIAKFYVKYLFGRHPRFIDEIHFITPGHFKCLSDVISGIEMKIFPGSPRRWLNKIAMLYRHFILNDASVGSRVSFKEKIIRKGIGIICPVLLYLGFFRVFDVFISKR